MRHLLPSSEAVHHKVFKSNLRQTLRFVVIHIVYFAESEKQNTCCRYCHGKPAGASEGGVLPAGRQEDHRQEEGGGAAQRLVEQQCHSRHP